MSKSESDRIKELELALLKSTTDNLRLQQQIDQRDQELRTKEMVNVALIPGLMGHGEVMGSKVAWEQIVDEMAHSINTDISAAINFQSYHGTIPDIQKAQAHTKRIRDFVELIMLYLKKDEKRVSGEFVSCDLCDVIKTALESIESGISTLRISSDEHEERLLALLPKTDVQCQGGTTVSLNIEIAKIYDLLFMDLIRNALKNTDEETPEISISTIEKTDQIQITIMNNSVISEDFENWFNGNDLIDPEISKSTKVGLRIIKKWMPELKMSVFLKGDKQNNRTETIINVQKRLRWKK